jgi:putative transferase (TIGR04331 family)
LGLIECDDPLERLAGEAMPALLPRSLLEDFATVERKSRRRYGRPMHVLVGNYSIDEVENEFLARSRVAGCRFAFSQHGGFYLQSPVNSQERLEIEPESTFLSWGGGGPNIIPTANSYLERLRDSHRGGTRITIVEALEPPDAYVVRFAGTPLGNQGYETARMLAEMVELLPAPRRSQLVLKRFPNPVGPPAWPGLLEALPQDGPAGGAATWMARSRLAVIPYFDTPFIEAIVIGTPTIGLWNPHHWPVRQELEPLLERLGAVRIVHSDPRSAAAHIDSVYDDVGRWWASEDVARLRAELLYRVARGGDWLDAWTLQLRRLRGT